MPADRQSGAGVVRSYTFVSAHLLQWHRFGIFAQDFGSLSKQGTFQLARAFHLPRRITAVFDEPNPLPHVALR
jgi:hypothetical protein